MTAQPRYATRPNPGALHDTAAVARLAVVLRRPLMPWQLTAVRIGTERHPDDPSRYRYREVRITVPRQSGKTTQAHVKNLHRTITYAGLQAFYTAQTGKDARARWTDARKIVERSPLERFATVKLGAGDTSLTWPSGSALRPFAPTAASLHGYTPDLVDEDEVWAYDELQGAALDGAVIPAQITLPHAQRWRYSTMGDADSTYWHRLVDEGRAATEDPDATVAYLEWSADPDRDPYDPAHWADFHPAVGHTITAADLAAAAKNTPETTWLRAFCNLRVTSRDTTVDLAAFDALADPELRLAGKGSALAFDVARDNSQATITMARPVGEDSVAVRVVRSAPGSAWLTDAVAELADRFGLQLVHADDRGPVREVTDELRRRGRTVETTSGVDYATACGAWMRRVRDGRLVWDGSAVLRDAQAVAVTRPMGDAVAFSRTRSAGPIDALVASCVAVRAALLAPAPAPAPLIFSG